MFPLVCNHALLMNLSEFDVTETWNFLAEGLTTSLALISNTRKLNPQRTLWSSNLHLLGSIFVFSFRVNGFQFLLENVHVDTSWMCAWNPKVWLRRLVHFHESLFLQSESVSSVSSKTIMVYSVVLSSSRTSRKSHNLQWKKTSLSGPLILWIGDTMQDNPYRVDNRGNNSVKIEVWKS